MRNRYLVSYDVVNPKRLRKMYKKLCGFGDPTQLSVFLCRLSEKEKVLLIEAICGIMNRADDRVMIVDLGPTEGRGEGCITFLGRREEAPEMPAVVV
jgi:CRISPR-associated protein Cas2